MSDRFGKDTPAWARKETWTNDEIISLINEGRLQFEMVAPTSGNGKHILMFTFIPVPENEVDNLITWM
jgi:hypothetical protein